MIRRSKLKVRPAIRRSQPSSQSTSVVTLTPDASRESLSQPEVEDESTNVSKPSSNTTVDATKTERPNLEQAESKYQGHMSIEESSKGSGDVDNTSQNALVKSPGQITRRRKLVACPTAAKKRQKLSQPNNKSLQKSKNSVTTVAPSLSPMHQQPGKVSDITLQQIMPEPDPPQVVQEVVGVTTAGESSSDIVTLTPVTNASLEAELNAGSATPEIIITGVETNVSPVPELGNSKTSDQNKQTSVATGEPRNDSNSKVKQTNLEQIPASSHASSILIERKLPDSTNFSKKIVMKQKTLSSTAKHRNSAMAKLKKLKQKQDDDSKWPELDQNVVSMSDLIFLNPPNKVGLTLGMNAEREKAESAIAQKENPPAKSDEADPPEEKKEDEALPVPQIRIAEDGSVVIDEESLILDTRKPPDPKTSTVYEFGKEGMVNQCSFLRRPYARSVRWTQQETDKFYRCLCIVGAEFSLMGAMFRGRTADDLRRKFKRERKLNPSRIDKALMQQHLSKWTDDMFEPKESCQSNETVLNTPKPPEETVR